MTILIIEDEVPASERLIAMVREFDPGIRIPAVLRGVKESVEWFERHPAPDLILADIQLNDGLSFEIFKKAPVLSPLVFTTAFDEYLQKAFEVNSIDYLLKPIKKEKLFQALNKYASLRRHFTGDIAALLGQLNNGTQSGMRRIVVKKGGDFVAIKTEEIAYFYTEHKLVFLVDRERRKYVVDRTLAELEHGLDNARFFRLNRKYLAAVDAIVRFTPSDKGKIRIELHPPAPEEVTVSQEHASAFREWIGK